MFFALHLHDLFSCETLLTYIVANQVKESTCTEHDYNDHNDILDDLEEH